MFTLLESESENRNKSVLSFCKFLFLQLLVVAKNNLYSCFSTTVKPEQKNVSTLAHKCTDPHVSTVKMNLQSCQRSSLKFTCEENCSLKCLHFMSGFG